MGVDTTSDYRIADYLFDRVAELGCTEIFGVPGDFNMGLLDVIDDHPRLRWVGNANELNAGYAADAYARLREFAVVVTTYGVGELSAINATAGSFSEYVPVLHIVGVPRTDLQRQGLRLHHTLGDGTFTHFMDMHSHVTVAQAHLTAENAAGEIDRVLAEMLKHSRPGYLMVPADVALADHYPADQPLSGGKFASSPHAYEAFSAAIEQHLRGKSVTVLADLLVHRLGARGIFDEIIAATDVPYSTLAWGKSLVDESSPRFAGIYAGQPSTPRARAAVEDAEALVSLGVLFNDTTSAGFSQQIDDSRAIVVGPDSASVGGKRFAPLSLKDATRALLEHARKHPWEPTQLAPARDAADEASAPADDAVGAGSGASAASGVVAGSGAGSGADALTQERLWPALAARIRDSASAHCVLADQGTAFFGIATQALPKDTFFIGQPMWGSIGYTLPATLGAGLADPARRPILLIGDGAAQLTVQELGTMFREQVHPIIVLINNDGYSVERAIHGPHRNYNDIVGYSWLDLPSALGGTPDNYLGLRASTFEQLDEAFAAAAATPDKLVVIEVITDRYDYPEFLSRMADSLKAK